MSPASDYRPSPGTAMLVASRDGKVHCWTKVPTALKNGVQFRYASALLKLQIASGLAGDSVLESAVACQVLRAGVVALEDRDKVNRGRQDLRRATAGTYPSCQRCCAASAPHSGKTQGGGSPLRSTPPPPLLSHAASKLITVPTAGCIICIICIVCIGCITCNGYKQEWSFIMTQSFTQGLLYDLPGLRFDLI
jgi:hypothetical protein